MLCVVLPGNPVLMIYCKVIAILLILTQNFFIKFVSNNF